MAETAMMSTQPEAERAVLERIDTADIVRRWDTELGIDVGYLFEDVPELCLLSDPASGLEFFDPPVAGDEGLYQKLQEIPWYYLEEKWEYERALKSADASERILEVGSGFGAFLRFAQEAGHSCTGIELNTAAAEAGRQAGLDLHSVLLDQFIESNPEPFDRVVSFQVLEHVLDPVALLRDMVRSARPGGVVCMAVPNAGSFISYDNAILDMPPHHISRWRDTACRKLCPIIGAKSVVIDYGPLEPIHFRWYADLLSQRYARRWRVPRKVARKAILAALKFGIADRIHGHTLYAEFTC